MPLRRERGTPSGRVITCGTEWRHCCEAAGRLRGARARREELYRLQGALAWLGVPPESPPRGGGGAETLGLFMPVLLHPAVRAETLSRTGSGELGWRPLWPLVEE